MATKKKITETGPVGLRGVRGTDLYNNLTKASASGDADAAVMLAGLSSSKPTPYSFGDVNQYYTPVQDASNSPWRELGNSIYDEPYIMGDDVTDINQTRALNESTLAKWGAGLGKGLVLAGTTFLDGTLGLLYGAGSAIANIGNENETGWQTFSRLWDNDISNGLQEINKAAEEAMPNYQTKEEQENAWYKNLGTANFWADGVLKNMGFMVGAFYSGGAWTKALNYGAKGIEALKGALTTTKSLAEAYKAADGIGTMGTRIIGSVLSATNEARIEANQNSSQWKDLEYQKAADAYGIDVNTLKTDPTYANAVKMIDEAGAKVGAIDFWSNLPLLAADDFMLYGKLYSRGFSNARDIAKDVTKAGEKSGNWLSRGWNRIKQAGNEGLQAEAKEAANVALEDGKYVAKKLTAKDTWGKVLKTGIREGNEEMSQQMAANFAGDLYETDSPDTYIKALNNPNAQLQANDFMGSLTKSFADSYGSGDQWEQFAVGAISSLLGMPTFGKVNNSDANTVLGRGKSVGWSGGILGEFFSDRATNQEAQRNVDTMNKVVDRIKSQQRHYAMSNSFTDAMDGFSEEGDKFEYKNAEDNLDFSSIQAFSNTGRLDDLKQLVNQDFNNMSADELGKIATFTSKQDKDGNPIGGWQTADGKPMATIDEDGNVQISEENQQKMRDELNKKKETILKQIDDYGKAIQTVRGTGNNSLTDEQNQELAWLLWKQNQFKDRFGSVKKENAESFEGLLSGLNHWEEALIEERKNLTVDTKVADSNIYRTNENGEKVLVAKKGEHIADEESTNTKTFRENTNMLNAVRSAKSFIEQIQSSDSPLYLASYLKDRPEFSKLMRSEGFFDFVDALSSKSGMDFAKYNQAMQDLIDSERLAKAADTFNERYKEFVSNPMSVISGRENIAAQNEAKTQASSKVNKRDDINKASVSDIVEQAEAGADLDEMKSMFDSINEGGAPKDSDEANQWQQEGKQKVQAAKNIIDTKNKTAGQLGAMLANGSISQQQYDDAMTLLNNASHTSNTADEMTDLASFSLNDVQSLEVGNVDQSITPEELDDYMNNRVDEAKNALSEAFATVQQAKEDTDNLPDSEKSELASAINADTTGENLAGAKEEVAKQQAALQPTEAPKTAPKTETPKVTSKEDTGHDSTPKVQSENEKQKAQQVQQENQQVAVEEGPQGLANTIAQTITQGMPEQMAAATNQMIASDLGNISQELHNLKQQGVSAIEAIHSIKNTKPMQNLAQMLGGNTQAVEQAINSWWNKAPQGVTQDKEIESEEPIVSTTEGPTDTQAALDTARSVETANNSITGSLQYWKPTTSEVSFGFVRGEQIPFWKEAQNAENGDGSPKYTKEQIDRYKALYEYLQAHNAWNNAFNAKEGEVVNFIIDPSLNTSAGEQVILMSVNGKIVGDVMSSNDYSFNRQTGLKEFVDRVTKEYNDWVAKGNTGIFTSQETSKVSKKMVGKVPYAESNTRNTLNEIHTTTGSTSAKTKIPFKIGIQVNEGGNRMLMTPGRTRRQGASTEEGTIIPSLSARAGQPFLLMPTGSSKRAYIPVPITMPRYSADTADTRLGKEIDKVLQKLVTIKKGQETSIIRELQELLCIPKMHLNILDNGNIKITMVAVNDTSQTTLYEGNPTTDGMIDRIRTKLYNTPFQISRKYINTTFKDGTDYNSMIGELATCNLSIGATHTISSWLTVNPVTAEGQQKAKNPKSTKNNPNATDSQFTQYTYSTASGTHVVAVNNQTYDIFLWNPTTKKWEAKPNAKDARATSFKAQTYINNNHITPTSDGLVQTPWGTYNVNTGVFVNAQVSNTDTTSHLQAPTTEDKKNGQVKFTFNEGGQVAKAPIAENATKEVTQEQLNTNEPTSIDKRIIIDSSLGGGVTQVYGYDPNKNAKDARATEFWRKRKSDSRSVKNPKTGNFRENFYVEFPDGTSMITYFSNKNERTIGRHDGMGITIWRKLTPEEVKAIQDYLWEGTFKSYEEVAQFVDKTMHPQANSTSSRPTYSATAELVMKELSPYFEGGGRLVQDDYELVPEEYVLKVEAAVMGDGPLSDEDAQKVLRWMKESRVQAAIRSVNSDWNKVKSEHAEQITSENQEDFLASINGHFVNLIGSDLAEELSKIGESTTTKTELVAGMRNSPTLSAVIPLFEAINDIVNEYKDIASKKVELPKSETKTDADYDKEATGKGLLTTNATKQMWQALSTEQKAAIVGLPKLKAKSVINSLARNFNVKSKSFNGDVDKIISGTRNRETTKAAVKPIDINKESKWLATVLPNLTVGDRVKVVNGLIKLSDNPNGAKAWGQFKQGVILISNQAARGTMYHEAFHAVVNILMDEAEINTLFDEAAKKYGNLNTIALEENLAEDFRRYVQLEETPVLGKAVRLFRTLKHLIQSIRGKETYLDNLFYRIQRGKFATKTPSVSEVIRNRMDTYDISKQMESLDSQYEQAVNDRKVISSYAAPFEGMALEHIRKSSTPDVLYTFQNRGRWRIGIISKDTYSQRKAALQNLLNKTYTDELSDDIRISDEALLEQDRYADELQEYYREKYLYSNLDESTKDYIKQRGLSVEDYSNMSQEEQETLLHCKL